MTQFKTIFTMTVFALFFCGGIATDAEAASMREGRNDIQPLRESDSGSHAEALYDELRHKGIDIMADDSLRPQDIKSIRKYLDILIANGLTVEEIRNYREGSQKENILLIKQRIYDILDKIAGGNYKNSSAKADNVKTVTHATSKFIGAK